MKKNRVLVTGANGYIGSHVVNRLIQLGHSVVACDIQLDHVSDKAIPLKADIFNPQNDIYAMAGSPDTLIHLAWRNGFRHNAETHLLDLPLHIQFIERMITAGVNNISIMGSMHEIGYWEGAITADTPTKPLSYYGVAKNALRQALEIMIKDKDICFHWLRGYYIYGDDKRSSSVLGKILEAEANGQELFPFTSGKNRYDYINVDELARQIVAATLQAQYTGIINCCSGQPISLGEMAERFIAEHNLNIRLQYGAFPDRAYDSPGIWGDATIINHILANEEA